MKQLRIHVLLLLAFAGITLPALAQVTGKTSERATGQWVLTLIISTLTSCVTGFLAANSRLNEFKSKSEFLQIMEKKRKEEKNRIQYLNPLRTSAEDLVERLKGITEKMKDKDQKDKVLSNFKMIKMDTIADINFDFDKWCNIDGYYAMSTLYITSVYFFRANKLRSEFPAAQLNPAQDEKLLQHLSTIRIDFGDEYGIWETIQDSIGSYIKKPDGSLMNYKEFCGRIGDSDNHVWFRRLIDFYVDFEGKTDYQVKKLDPALKDLVNFLVSMQMVEKPNATPLQRMASQLINLINRLKERRQRSSAILPSGPQNSIENAVDSENADCVERQAVDDR